MFCVSWFYFAQLKEMGILCRSEFVLCQVKSKKLKFLLWVAVYKHIKAENAQAFWAAMCLYAAMSAGVCSCYVNFCT